MRICKRWAINDYACYRDHVVQVAKTLLISRRLSAYATIAICTFFAIPLLASGTWIMANNPIIKKPTPGTIGSGYGWWGWGYFVDMKSIIKRGNIVFFNEAWVALGQDKRPCRDSLCQWDHSRNIPARSHPRIANCTTKQIGNGMGERNFKDVSGGRLELLQFVCRNS